MFDHRQPGNPHGLAHPYHPDCTGVSASWCPVHGDCMCDCDCQDKDVSLCSWGDHPECTMLNDDNCALHEYVPENEEARMLQLKQQHQLETIVAIRERIG